MRSAAVRSPYETARRMALDETGRPSSDTAATTVMTAPSDKRGNAGPIVWASAIAHNDARVKERPLSPGEGDEVAVRIEESDECGIAFGIDRIAMLHALELGRAKLLRGEMRNC